jgi:hypothetical protein
MMNWKWVVGKLSNVWCVDYRRPVGKPSKLDSVGEISNVRAVADANQFLKLRLGVWIVAMALDWVRARMLAGG